MKYGLTIKVDFSQSAAGNGKMFPIWLLLPSPWSYSPVIELFSINSILNYNFSLVGRRSEGKRRRKVFFPSISPIASDGNFADCQRTHPAANSGSISNFSRCFVKHFFVRRPGGNYLIKKLKLARLKFVCSPRLPLLPTTSTTYQK